MSGCGDLVTCEIKTATDVTPSYRDGFVDVEACATLVFTVKGDHWFEREITSPGVVGLRAGNGQRIRQAKAAELEMLGQMLEALRGATVELHTEVEQDTGASIINLEDYAHRRRLR